MLLKFLDVEHFVSTNALIPVTSADIYTKDGSFDEDGLFSDVIFGKDSDIRKKSFSYINLNCEIVHPTALDIINRLDRKLTDFIFTSGTYLLDDDGSLYEDPNGLSGVENFKKIFQKIKFRGGTSERESFIKLIQESYTSGILFIKKILVIPPEFRPVFKDPATGEEIRDAVNDFYIKILRHSNTMRSASGGGIFYDILNANMQKSVNDFDDYIKAKLGHKHGLIREQILGKRVDFSARTVIVNGPTLKPHEAGIPIGRAVSIFEPFILNVILKKKAKIDNDLLIQKIKEFVHQEFSIDTIKKLLLSIKNNDTVPSDLFEMMFIVISKAMEGRLVLLKRDPALRPESVRAFVPILTRNDVISISNLITSGFNADFDGDMMAVIHPLSNEAQEDAKKMIRVQSADNMSAMTIKLAKDTAIGIYILTKDYPMNKKPIQITEDLFEKSTDPTVPVIYKNKITTMGRAIFNSCLPEGFRFIETPIKSSDMDKLLDEIYRKYAATAVSNAAHKLMLYAYKFVTIASPSLTIDNFIMPDSILKEKEKLELTQSVDENIKLLAKLQKMMEAHFSGTALHDLIESGASKGWGQPFQIFVSKGFVSDVKGNLLPPIKGSYAEGLSAEEHFNASYGSRKGIVDRVISTSDTGYTSRQLVYLLNGVELDPHNEDCKTKRSLPIRLNKTIIGRLEGRYIVDGGTAKEFIKSDYKDGDVINLRSPIYCTAKNNKICLTCYGKKVAARVKTPYIGVLAAQLIGEEGTQATMRCTTGLVHYDNNLIPFEDLFKNGVNYTKEHDLETVDLNINIDGKFGKTKTTVIQKHPANDEMLLVTTRSGAIIICQQNHPLFIKKDPIHHKYDNKFCRLVDDNSYIEYMSTRKVFRTENEDLVIKEAKDLIKDKDFIWIDNSIAINSKSDVVPELTGYLTGIYCAEGCKVWSDRKTKGNFITQHTEGVVKERIEKELDVFIRWKRVADGFWIWDNEQRVNNIILGHRAWEKRLRYDFINFDKTWLLDFLAGWIDGDGSVFTRTATVCRIYTTSYYLTMQLYAICMKLGLNFKVSKATYSKKYKRTRLSFACDISFHEGNVPEINSEKIKRNGEIKPAKLRENVIRGFDKIVTIRKIEEWNYPVYDIKTETEEYLINCVQTHNSFHQGGAIKLENKDIIKDLVENGKNLEK